MFCGRDGRGTSSILLSRGANCLPIVSGPTADGLPFMSGYSSGFGSQSGGMLGIFYFTLFVK